VKQGDELFIPAETGDNKQFEENMARFDKYLGILHKKLFGRFSVPFWSPRYSAHMIMDTSMPATLGYFATMLYNPDNVAVEASPITTVLELEAGKQLCKLLGFRLASKTTVCGFGDKPGEPTIEPDYGPDQISAWGHVSNSCENSTICLANFDR
jgi:hypothetical protein